MSVISLFLISQSFSVVELIGLRYSLLELGLDVSSSDGNFLVVGSVLVLVERRNESIDLFDGVLVLTLVTNHELKELIFLFLELSVSLVDLTVSLNWRSEHFPLSVVVFLLLESILELIKDIVDVHTVVDISLELLNVLWYSSHVLLNCRKLFNVLGGGLHLHVHLLEVRDDFVGVSLGSVGNELGDSLSNVSVLMRKGFFDFFTVNLKHGDIDTVWDLIRESLGLLVSEDDLFFELRNIRGVICIIQVLYNSIWVELILLLVDVEGSQVLLHWLNAVENLFS
jgi:hypothetical protein